MNVPYQKVEDGSFHIYQIDSGFFAGATVGARNRVEAKKMAKELYPNHTSTIKAIRGAVTNIHGVIERWDG